MLQWRTYIKNLFFYIFIIYIIQDILFAFQNQSKYVGLRGIAILYDDDFKENNTKNKSFMRALYYFIEKKV